VGHSTGAIVLNEIVRQHGDIAYESIVYMAAACSVREFADAVVPYMRSDKGQKTNVYNLTLYPTAEARERLYPWEAFLGVDLLPRGSLVEWIDNFYALPLTVPGRTLGKFENIMRCLHMIPEYGVDGDKRPLRQRVTLTTFDIGPDSDGKRLGPEDHGDFGSHRFWLPSFWKGTPAPIDP